MAAEAANLEDDLSLLREPLEQLAERSTRLHEIYEWEANRRMFGTLLSCDSQRPVIMHAGITLGTIWT